MFGNAITYPDFGLAGSLVHNLLMSSHAFLAASTISLVVILTPAGITIPLPKLIG